MGFCIGTLCTATRAASVRARCRVPRAGGGRCARWGWRLAVARVAVPLAPWLRLARGALSEWGAAPI